MAWQLIYTSAPRLLEAGRTGFGTVARHRAVSGLIASSVERFSQFARLPGHDTRRIVHACRILTVGSGTYHVLTCLQDAGSDYTGRTNHIAHHLIAEPREIRALSAAGLTPADVLLAMKWRTSWSDGPRFLDPAEEVDLSSFTTTASQAWAAVTGSPASARILGSREALKGCYLIIPPGINALDLFGEALRADPAQAWQTPFTTCLEPNDDVADFRWVALSSSSPLLTQVETSSRLVLDLTRPGTLPAPPDPDAPAPEPEPVPDPVKPPAPEPARTAPAEVQKQTHPPVLAAPAVSSMGGWSPEPRQSAPKPGKNFIVISLVIAALLVVVVLSVLLRQDNLQVQARADYDRDIAQTWKDRHLILTDTRKLLEEQSDLAAGKALLKSHVEFFNSVQQLLKKPGTAVLLPLPAENKDDLRDLNKLLEEWAELHGRPWAKLPAGKDAALGLHSAYRRWQDSRTSIWKKLNKYLSLKDTPPPEDALIQALKDKARELLRSAEPARGTLAEWELVFALPVHPKNDLDSKALQWLHLWAALNDPGPGAYATAQTVSADSSLPAWLRAKAAALKQRQDQEHENLLAAQSRQIGEQRALAVQKQLAATEDADAMSAGISFPIFIRLLQPGEDPAGKVTGLPVIANMQLYVGGAWDAHPRPDPKTEPKNGELKKWAATSLDGKDEIKFGPTLLAKLTNMIRFSNDDTGTLTAIAEQYRHSSDGVRIVARSQDAVHVLFDLRLLPISSVATRPVFTQVIDAAVNNAETVTLSLPAGLQTRLHLLALPNPVYSLRREGTATEQRFYSLISTGESSFQVMPPQANMIPAPILQGIKRRISDLEDGIAKDDRDIAAIDGKKSSARHKDPNRETYARGRSDKEIQLQDLRAKLQGLEGPAPLHLDLQPGRHTLLLEQPVRLEFCRLNVLSSASPSQSKPTPP